MRLLRIELCDVGRFRRYAADLSGNVVCLLGPNGAGKSTILSAIQYAVTGDLARLGDKDEAVAKDRPAASKDRPFARLTFDPVFGAGAEGEATVTRWLPVDNKAGTRRLIYDGKAVTSKSEIEDLFAKWTGLAAKALSDYVFVEQGCLTDVVTDQTGRRAEVLQKLFGVAEAETARVALLEHLAKLPRPADQELLATVRHQAAEAEHQLREAEAELAALDPPDPAREASDREILAAAKRGKDLAVAAESARARLTEAQAVLAAPPLEKPDPGLVRQANEVLAGWAAHRTAAAQYNEAVSRYDVADHIAEKLEEGLAALPHPGPEPRPPDSLLKLRDGKFAAAVVAGADKAGADCPVCGSAMNPEAADKAKAAALLSELDLAEAEYDLAAKSWRYATDVYAAAERKARDARERAFNLMCAFDATAVPPPPAVDEATARQLRDLATRAEAQAAADAQKRLQAEATIRTARATILAADSQSIPSDAAIAAAETRLAAAAEARTTRAAATAKQVAARKSYEAAAETIRKAEALGSSHAATESWRKVVEGAVAILHKDAAPAATIKACLADLSDDLNRRLGNLGASFRIVVNADGGLSAEFGGTKIIPARRLSGGEKVVLSLAWRLAVLDRYAPRAGVLCLDEPTNHLDDARVTALRDAIEAWRPHGADRQFIIVTHAKKLAAACDTVVQLG